MEKYNIISEAGKDKKVAVRRLSDGKVSRCKPTWLAHVSGEVYHPKNDTKAIRLDGLEWTTEG